MSRRPFPQEMPAPDFYGEALRYATSRGYPEPERMAAAMAEIAESISDALATVLKQMEQP
jgi:hypothetical protein